eukprot:scaffold8995_cov120-Isochrysis_galbana.AAC.5
MPGGNWQRGEAPMAARPSHWREVGAVLWRAASTSAILGVLRETSLNLCRAPVKTAQGGGERNLHLVFRGRWTIARGPSHTPFGGVRSLASTYRRCGANWAPPDSLYSHTMTIFA